MIMRYVMCLALLAGGLVSGQTLSLVLEEYEIFAHARERFALTDLKIEGTMHRSGAGAPFMLAAKAKNVHFNFTMGKNHKISMVSTPHHSWLTSSESGATLIQYFPGEFFPLMFWWGDLSTALYKAKDKGYQIRYEGQESTAEGDRFIVQISNTLEQSIVYSLSTKDYLPRKILIMTNHMGTPQTETYFLSNYQKVDGIPFPMHWESRAPDGRPEAVFEIAKVSLNPGLPAALFQLPNGDLSGPNVPKEMPGSGN